MAAAKKRTRKPKKGTLKYYIHSMKKYSNRLIIGALVLGYILYNTLTNNNEETTIPVLETVSTETISLNEFLAAYQSGDYTRVELIDETDLQGYALSDAEMPENPLAQFLPAGEPVERYELYTTQKPIHTTIAELGIDPSSEETVFVARFTESNFWTSLLIDFLPILFLIGLLVFMMRGMGKGAGALPFNVKIGKISDTKKVNTKFKDVAGMDEVKEELMEVVDYLKNPKKYHSVRARTPKGVLLYGEPGTGKTLLARAVAGESNVPFLYSSGAEFMGMFVGVGGEKVRSLFEKAKKMGKAIIFIDEIDAFGKKRGSGVGGHHQGQEEIVNQILTEMDGFDNKTSIVVIAATNRPDILDSALTRAGRFDRKVLVSRPTYDERLAIFNYYLTDRKVSKDLDVESLARRTSGFVGADIENVVNEAALKIAKDGRKSLTSADFEFALEKHLMGPEKKIKSLSDTERNIVTYHELGHAVTAYELDEADQVEKISIVSRGRALGLTWKSSDEDRYLHSKMKMIHEVISLLGGRAAEEVWFGYDQITTGASNDFERATRIISDMVGKYGMDEDLGPVMYRDKDKEDYSMVKPYSEKTAELLDEKIKKYLKDAYEEAKKILSDRKDDIDQMAKVLIAKEYLSKEEFELLMSDISQADTMIADHEKQVKALAKKSNSKKRTKTNKATKKKADTKSDKDVG